MAFLCAKGDLPGGVAEVYLRGDYLGPLTVAGLDEDTRGSVSRLRVMIGIIPGAVLVLNANNGCIWANYRSDIARLFLENDRERFGR